MASEKQKFDFEFIHEGVSYYTVGKVWIWSEEVIGTTFGEEVEYLYEAKIEEIDFDFIEKLSDDGNKLVGHLKEYKEIAIEAVTNKFI